MDGRPIWARLRPTMEFVIAHPNGWYAAEQGVLRNAAIAAGLVPPSDLDRIHFVNEAEASVHFVTHHANLESQLAVSAPSCN